MPNSFYFKDHPRIRGTNYKACTSEEECLGSSPHTRDKFGKVYEKYGEVRIIPAYAGQILGADVEEVAPRDHPRIRGTNSANQYAVKASMGSSPHTRDKSITFFQSVFILGIIPAYAGQILGADVEEVAPRDHPRIRGTNSSSPLGRYLHLGSSPHTRDK